MVHEEDGLETSGLRAVPSGSKIVAGSVHLMRVPRKETIRSSYAMYEAIEVVAVQLRTSDGLIGQGWTNVIGTGCAAIGSFIETDLLPLAVGTDPVMVRSTWDTMYRHSMSRGRKGIAMYALSAVDIALWDLLAQQAGMPLHWVLGASRTSVPVYGDGCWLSMTVAELQAETERYMSSGMWGVKLKIGGDPDSDLARVAAVRQVLRPGAKLMVDANQRYDRLQAIEMARRLEDLDVFWFEEPILADLAADYAAIAARTRIAIAAGENEYTRYGFRSLIVGGGVGVLQPDVHRVGGITEFLHIVSLAEAFGLPVAPHTSFELHSQLVAATTCGLVCEYYDWFPPDFFDHQFDIRNGEVSVPVSPGLAARFSPDVFARYGM